MSERGRGRAWDIPYKEGDMVLWTFYDYCEPCEVKDVAINYVSIQNMRNGHKFRVYEDQIDKYLRRLT